MINTYIKIGVHKFCKHEDSFLWVHYDGKYYNEISYLKVCSLLAQIWQEIRTDKFAIQRYNEGEFGFGGLQYDMAKRLRREYRDLTKEILKF